jgi:hypothetical protein
LSFLGPYIFLTVFLSNIPLRPLSKLLTHRSVWILLKVLCTSNLVFQDRS